MSRVGKPPDSYVVVHNDIYKYVWDKYKRELGQQYNSRWLEFNENIRQAENIGDMMETAFCIMLVHFG